MMDFDDLDAVAPARRLYDIVVYGASGYTGCLVTEHLDWLLSQPGAPPHRWAVAGRTLSKLQTLARKCKSGPKVVCASSPAELRELAGDCHVLIAVAGPYLECGEEVVKACVEQRTHYVDVTGEVTFMHRIISRYHTAAKENGVMIVQAMAALSATDDACAYVLAKKLGPLTQFREYEFGYGLQTGGSFATGLAVVEQMLPDTMRVYADPFSLGGRRSEAPRPEDADAREAQQDPIFPSLWVMPGYGTHTNSRVVRRTVQLFDEDSESGLRYGDRVSVTIRDAAFDEKSACFAVFANPVLTDIKETVRQTRTMEELRKRGMAAEQGSGPPEAIRAMGASEIWAVAQGESGEWAHAHLTGPDGYETTAIASVVGALVLLEEEEKVNPRERGGVLTPAFALHGSSWIERLQEHPFAGRPGPRRQIKIEVKDGKPREEEVAKALEAMHARRKAGAELLATGTVKHWDRPALLA